MHALEFVNKPVISPGDPHPGRRTMTKRGPVWQGEIAWETRHGAATLLWVAGHVAGVFNSLNPDGKRDQRLEPVAPEIDMWRRRSSDGSFVAGRLEVRDDDVLFTDAPFVQDESPWPSGTLAAQLLASEPALQAVEDRSFAVDLYGSLAAAVWTCEATGKEFSGRWDKAAEIVVRMRGLGEIPCDFYNEGNEGFVTDEAANLLAGLGWRLSGRMETAAQKHARAAKLVEVCEGRDYGPMPGWYAHWITGASDDGSLFGRVHAAAFAGQVSYKEWITFWEFADCG